MTMPIVRSATENPRQTTIPVLINTHIHVGVHHRRDSLQLFLSRLSQNAISRPLEIVAKPPLLV